MRRGFDAAAVPRAAEKMAALRHALEQPNAGDSFRTLFEQVLEDVLVGGFGAAEMRATHDPARPFELFAVDGAQVQVDPRWNGDAEAPRFGFTNVGFGNSLASPAVTPLEDAELMYIRLNPRTHNGVRAGAAGGGL